MSEPKTIAVELSFYLSLTRYIEDKHKTKIRNLTSQIVQRETIHTENSEDGIAKLHALAMRWVEAQKAIYEQPNGRLTSGLIEAEAIDWSDNTIGPQLRFKIEYKFQNWK